MQIWLLLGFFIWSSVFPAAKAQVDFKDVGVFVQFGRQVTFQAKIDSPTPIQEVYLFIQPEGEKTRLEAISLNEFGEAIFEFDPGRYPLQPFSRIYYWFRVVCTDGEPVESQRFWFDYQDNRFTWQTLENRLFRVYWYDRDLAFGQTVLNTAEAGLKSATSYLPVAPKIPLKIYVYSSTTDLQNALQLSGHNWVAGQANPELGVILVSIAPGPQQTLELERQLPHEIMHTMQYQQVGDAFRRLPFWLTEGSASLAELYPNPEYQSVLERAVKEKTLLPLTSLCSASPPDSSQIYLAYAQSASFVRFVFQKYGSNGLLSLNQKYQEGLGCEEAVSAALGVSLNQLENRWQREALGLNSALIDWQNILLIIMLPVALFMLVALVAGPKIYRRLGSRKS